MNKAEDRKAFTHGQAFHWWGFQCGITIHTSRPKKEGKKKSSDRVSACIADLSRSLMRDRSQNPLYGADPELTPGVPVVIFSQCLCLNIWVQDSQVIFEQTQKRRIVSWLIYRCVLVP